MDDAITFFLAPKNGYLAVRDSEGALVGFCCFGFEGQVPGGDYSVDALDVGIGMRPELTGQGLGYDVCGRSVGLCRGDICPTAAARDHRRFQPAFAACL